MRYGDETGNTESRLGVTNDYWIVVGKNILFDNMMQDLNLQE